MSALGRLEGGKKILAKVVIIVWTFLVEIRKFFGYCEVVPKEL